MKRTLSMILAALLLASSMTACGNTAGNTDPSESKVSATDPVATNTPVTESVETDSAETEAPAPAYDASLITENGVAKAHIVLAEGASSTEKFAAEELVYHIKKISGADVTVTNTVEEGSLPIIIATPDTMPELETLFPEDIAWLTTLEEEDGRRWGDDGFAIRLYDNKIYIFGTVAKGALNGTYDFIEDNMGVLWARSNEEIGLIYTEQPTITVTKTDYREKSPFQIRGWHIAGLSDQQVSQNLFVRNKLNSMSAAESEEKGIDRFAVAHNLKYMLLCSPVYDPEVTEYWNTTSSGNFLSPESSMQINFWSDKAVEAVAQSVITYVRDGAPNPAVAAGTDHIFIGIEDANNGLTVPFDSQPYEYAPGEFVEPSDKSFQSTVYFDFINKVARKVAEECPGTSISTFAYMFTSNAPKCNLEDNVVVVMAPIGEDLISDLYDETSSGNMNFLKRMDEWMKVTKNMVFYNYFGCFKAADRYSRPIWDNIKTLLQYYAANGFVGLQSEGIGDDENGYWWVYDGFGGYTGGGQGDVPNSATWDMNAMVYWIYAKLCWNPEEDVDALIVEFCDKYYGGASEQMQEYYRLIEAGWKEGKQYQPYAYAWNTGFDVYMDCFIYNDYFVENAGLHEKILETLNNAWDAANDIEKERIRYIKETMEASIADWSYVPE